MSAVAMFTLVSQVLCVCYDQCMCILNFGTSFD